MCVCAPTQRFEHKIENFVSSLLRYNAHEILLNKNKEKITL